MLRAVILAGVSAAVLTGTAAASAASGLASRPDDTASANGRVAAIVRVGGTVYLGGSFTSITRKDGTSVTRNRLAAIDAVTALNPGASSSVRALALSPDGSGLYIAGSFSTINGSSRPRLARVSASNGTVSSWKPAPGYIVLGIALSGDGSRIHLAGDSSGGHAGAFATSTNTRLWDRTLDGDANAVAVSGETVYVGGHYHRAAGATREHLAAFNAATGALDPWNPGANSVNGIYAVVVTSSRLYAGGEFTVIGGVSQPRFAQFSGPP